MHKIISWITAAVVLISGCSASHENDAPEVEIQSEQQYIGSTVEAASAQEFVEGMGLGWNLGNTLDPVDCNWLSNEMEYETSWGNPKVTKELISYIKSEGIDTIRVPVTWKNHVGEAPEYTISADWLARVKEIISWCVEEDMYIILNMHHEGTWLTKASTDYDNVMTEYKAIWSQLAEEFGEYSNKLIFESMNEIGFDDLGTEKGCELMNKINAEFVKLVRNSGHNNADRYLLLAGYWTDIDRSCQGEGITVPEGDDKLIVSMHYYSPATFAIADKTSTWGYQESWGSDADYKYLDRQMNKLKKKFIDNGIPVIMGEFGCTLKDKDLTARKLYLAAVTEYCAKYGICPVLWDNGEEINRTSLSWRTEGLGETMRESYQNGKKEKQA